MIRPTALGTVFERGLERRDDFGIVFSFQLTPKLIKPFQQVVDAAASIEFHNPWQLISVKRLPVLVA